jgi:hypothetical protein
MELLQFSTWATFVQLLGEEKAKHTKEEVIALLGNLKRVLKLIQRKGGVEEAKELPGHNYKDIISII